MYEKNLCVSVCTLVHYATRKGKKKVNTKRACLVEILGLELDPLLMRPAEFIGRRQVLGNQAL